MKGEHVKDAAQDESVKVFILPIAILQWRRTGSRGPSSSTPGCVHVRPPTTAHLTPLPHHHRRRRCRRQHVKDAAQGFWRTLRRTTSTASTRCAVEAALLPASKPPTNSPSKKNQDDHHRDRNCVLNRLAAAFVEHFDTLRGSLLCYGCHAGTTKDVKSQVKELARSILCDLVSARWPQ